MCNFLKKFLQFDFKSCRISVGQSHPERWLSWSKAHDWKSCKDLNSFKGSNPFLSAKQNRHPMGVSVFAFTSKKGIRGVGSE